MHRLIFGSRSPQTSRWLPPLAHLLSAVSLDFSVSENIEQDMWDKWIFLSTLAASTCAMRASIGAILETIVGETFILGLLGEKRKCRGSI